MAEDGFTPSVAVDLDGVLAAYDGWQGIDEIGDPLPGAREFMEALSEDFEVVIFTTRANPDPFNEGEYREAPQKLRDRIKAWLREHEIPYDRVFSGKGKPIACAYVDDRAVRCMPQDGGSVEFRSALEHVKMLDPREGDG